MIDLKLQSAKQHLGGIIPPLTVPFDQDGDIIFGALGEQIDHAVASGVLSLIHISEPTRPY